MTDLTLFVIGFGIFAMCIAGTLALSIGGSQQVHQSALRNRETTQAGATQE